MFVTKLVCLFVCVKIITAGDLCQTPNSQKGECKPINDCPALFKLLEHRPVSSSNANHLKKSQCGFAGSRPKVCCPIESDAPPTSGSNPLTLDTSAPPMKPSPTKSTIGDGIFVPSREKCGIDNSDKIYIGHDGDADQLQWMALLEYQKPGGTRGFHCGGVLISHRYVLTAAHCLKGNDLPKTWNLTSVRLGEYDLKSKVDCYSYGSDCKAPPIDVSIQEQILHEEYNRNDVNRHHDIALLRLERNVEFSDDIKPICLHTTAEELSKSYVEQRVFIAGWGKTATQSYNEVRRLVPVKGKELKDCKFAFSAINVTLGEGQLCVDGETKTDLCSIDGEGPLMVRSSDKDHRKNWFVVGIVSFAPSPCDAGNSRGVHAKVSKYTPWILNKLKA